MSRKNNPRSRWLAGNVRYDQKTLDYILRHYREPEGWSKGARVQRR